MGDGRPGQANINLVDRQSCSRGIPKMFARTAVLAVAASALVALTACDTGSTDTTAAAPATTTTAPAASTTTAAPTTAAPTTPTKTTPAKPKNGCPVTAATLQGLAGYPAGWKVNASSIKCKDNWAIAGMTAPSPDKQGDGNVYFAYDAKSGKWAKKGEGSSVECGSGDAMNVPAGTGFCG